MLVSFILFKNNFMKKNNLLLNIFIVVCLILIFFYLLIIWASLLQPLVIALILSAAIISLSNFFEKWFKKIKFLPNILTNLLAMILSISTYLFIFWLISKTFETNIAEFKKILPTYQTIFLNKINLIQTFLNNINFNDFYLSKYFEIPTRSQDILQIFKEFNIAKQATSFFWEATKIFTQIFTKTTLILIYVLFILLEHKNFKHKIDKLFSDNTKRKHFVEITQKISQDIKSYFIVKTIVSFLTWLLSYIVMSIVGLDLALFWATIIFLLNYIPTIGSMVASILPMLLSLVQFESIYPFLFISAWIIWTQQLMWNILEPRYMWNKLNLSPFVILMSLWIWWSVWWVLWMLLSVPFMVIVNIVLSKFESTRPIAVLLSEKWNLYIENYISLDINKKKLFEEVRKKIETLQKIKN